MFKYRLKYDKVWKHDYRGANALGTLTALGAWFLPARLSLYKTSSQYNHSTYIFKGNITIMHLHVITGKSWHFFLESALQVSWGILVHTESFTWSGKNFSRQDELVISTSSQTWWGTA